MKNKKFLILSFFIPFLVYLIVFLINGLFTNKMIIMGDSYAQYFPLMNYLKGVLDGTNSIFYSFYKSLGGSMIGTYFYYLSSPFNFLLKFVNKNYILDFMTILTLIKLSLCGLTMYIYMSKKFNKNNCIILAFSLLYAFMGYNLNYFLEIMWLDVVLLAPLVLLGLDNIINNKSPILYIVTLFISIYSNYYIAYMLCIFLVLYFYYEIFTKYNLKQDKKTIIKLSKKFFIISILTGIACFIFLIPCIIEMTSYGRNIKFKDIFYFDYNIFNLLAKTYMATIDGDSPFDTNAINIYCGIITLPLVYLYLKNKKIDKKNKYLTLTLIIIMILPCFIGLFNFIFHAFTIPVGFYYRYSFLLCLFLLIIAYKSISNLEINSVRVINYIAVYFSYSLIIIFIHYLKNYYKYIDYISIWLTCIFLSTYLLLLLKIKNKKLLNKIIFTLIIIESLLNVYLSFNKYNFSDRKYLNERKQINEIINKYPHNRVKDLETNTSLIYNYMGTSSFLSTINHKTYDTLYKLYNDNTDANNFNVIDNVSYIADSILGIDLFISKHINNNYDLIENKTINDLNYYVYKNPTSLSLGYIVNDNCNNIENIKFYDNKAFNCLTNTNTNYYKELNYEYDDNYLIYSINKDYFYLYDDNLSDNIKYYENLFDGRIISSFKNYLVIKDNTTVKIDKKYSPKLYYFDYDLYKESFNNLNIEKIDYKINKNTLEGSINTKGGLLLITIPYEDNIKVYVDDKLVEKEIILDTFIGIRLDSGYHKIKIKA